MTLGDSLALPAKVAPIVLSFLTAVPCNCPFDRVITTLEL